MSRNRTFRLLGTLGAELDLRLRDPANRYSVEKSMQSLAGLFSHPDIGTAFAKLINATCVALDLDDIQSFGCAARSMYAVFGEALARTCSPPTPEIADQILERVDSFDWNLLASGEVRQLTDEAVRRFAPQFRELPRRHLKVLRARFYLRRR